VTKPTKPPPPAASETDDTTGELTAFERDVLAAVATLQPGDVATYGEIAAEIGKPGAARAVGSTLRRHGSGVPWWRVVAANGRLVPGGEARQRAKLDAEGVVVRNGKVVMGADNLAPGGIETRVMPDTPSRRA
jgi:O-6-methylguanine DNA methyltransferase